MGAEFKSDECHFVTFGEIEIFKMASNMAARTKLTNVLATRDDSFTNTRYIYHSFMVKNFRHWGAFVG